MFGVQILLFIVAFVVVVAESWAGVIATEPVQQIFAISMGGFIIALLMSISVFVLARGAGRTGHSQQSDAVDRRPSCRSLHIGSFVLPADTNPPNADGDCALQSEFSGWYMYVKTSKSGVNLSLRLADK